MGLFDEIVCHYPFPDGFSEPYGWQTKDLGRQMGELTITEEGLLMETGPDMVSFFLLNALCPDPIEQKEVVERAQPTPFAFTGKVQIYGSNLGRLIPKGSLERRNLPLEGVDQGFLATHDDGPFWYRVYNFKFKKGKVVSCKLVSDRNHEGYRQITKAEADAL